MTNGELTADSTIKKYLIAQPQKGREQKQEVEHYNLQARRLKEEANDHS